MLERPGSGAAAGALPSWELLADRGRLFRCRTSLQFRFKLLDASLHRRQRSGNRRW